MLTVLVNSHPRNLGSSLRVRVELKGRSAGERLKANNEAKSLGGVGASGSGI